MTCMLTRKRTLKSKGNKMETAAIKLCTKMYWAECVKFIGSRVNNTFKIKRVKRVKKTKKQKEGGGAEIVKAIKWDSFSSMGFSPYMVGGCVCVREEEKSSVWMFPLRSLESKWVTSFYQSLTYSSAVETHTHKCVYVLVCDLVHVKPYTKLEQAHTLSHTFTHWKNKTSYFAFKLR